LVVAGGLHPANLARAIGSLAPDVVDVSSGVESSVGVKDQGKVRAFVAAAGAVEIASHSVDGYLAGNSGGRRGGARLAAVIVIASWRLNA
jgi:hypothetical protein